MENGVVILLGTLAVAIYSQHFLTFMILALLLAGMMYLSMRFNYA